MTPTLSPDATLMLRIIAARNRPAWAAPRDEAEAAMAELLDHGFIGELGEITPAGQAWLDAQEQR